MSSRARRSRPVRCKCGGGPTHHTLEETCWCPNCLRLPEAERCTKYDGVVVQVGDPSYRGRMPTIPGTRLSAIPRAGTLKRQIFDLIGLMHGATDDDLEYKTGRSHQSVSAARNDLMNDGLIEDSGERRPTRFGNAATVWVRRPV